MSKYHNDAVKLLELIGGKENVVAVTHCATRMWKRKCCSSYTLCN